MPQRIIGIDVGSYSIKTAVIERGLKSFAFVEFYERRIQYNELLSPEESVAIAIQGIVDDHNLTWDVSSAGFPTQRATSRLITFPFSSSKKISQTVQMEIESHIPFDVSEAVVDYVVVWRVKDASRVMVVYVQKKDLVKELTMLGSVGVDPRYICFDGLELANLVNLGMVPPEGAYAIIDIGHEKSTVTICHGRRLGYMRAISVAGRSITHAIAARLSVPLEEAERMKIEMGNIGVEPDEGEKVDDITRELAVAIRQVVDDFILHLRQTLFAYHESENIPVEGIYLCGGTSRLPGLDRYISDALKLNVAFLNCQDFHFNRLERADAHRHVIPQALALALRGAAGGGDSVNLRRGEFAFKGDVEQLGGSVRKGIFFAGFVVFLALVSFTASYYSVKRQIDKVRFDAMEIVKQSLPAIPARASATPKTAITYIKSKENEITERMAQIKASIGLSPFDVLKDVSAGLPPRSELKMDATEFNVTGDRVTLSGIVDNFKAVDTVKLAFEKSPRFANVTTGDVGKGVKGEVKFRLTMDIVQEKDAAAETAPQPKETGRSKKE